MGFSGGSDMIIDNLTAEFLERDVMAVANSVGTSEELCTAMQSTCSGNLAQFRNFDDCLAYMTALPLTTPECPILKGPTLVCRWTHTSSHSLPSDLRFTASTLVLKTLT